MIDDELEKIADTATARVRMTGTKGNRPAYKGRFGNPNDPFKGYKRQRPRNAAKNPTLAKLKFMDKKDETD